MSQASSRTSFRSFCKGFGDAFRRTAPATTKVIQHLTHIELDEAIAREKADLKYLSHEVRPEQGDLSTLVVRFRSSR
jgi:hypothetical protein